MQSCKGGSEDAITTVRKRAALNASPCGEKNKKKAREEFVETLTVNDKSEEELSVYREKEKIVEVENGARVKTATNLINMGTSTFGGMTQSRERVEQQYHAEIVRLLRELPQSIARAIHAVDEKEAAEGEAEGSQGQKKTQ